jgi:hypothetical protein
MKVSFVLGALGALALGALASTAGAFADQKDFDRVMANQTLVCNVNGTSTGTLAISFDEKAHVAKSDFCWGGEDWELDFSRNAVLITCGDDGRGYLLINASFDPSSAPLACLRRTDGEIDWKNSELTEAIAWQNMSAGYPFEDGRVRYLGCCLK